MSSSSSKASYGAVDADENAAVDRSFDAESAYYLKDSSSSRTPLTPRQRARRLLNVGVPILVAVMIMGGFAWFLLRDFNNLYPGRGGASTSTGSQRDHVIPTSGKQSLDDTSSSHPASVRPIDSDTIKQGSKPKSESSDAACQAHATCATLGLIGNCCPTDKGVLLECC